MIENAYNAKRDVLGTSPSPFHASESFLVNSFHSRIARAENRVNLNLPDSEKTKIKWSLPATYRVSRKWHPRQGGRAHFRRRCHQFAKPTPACPIASVAVDWLRLYPVLPGPASISGCAARRRRAPQQLKRLHEVSNDGLIQSTIETSARGTCLV